MLPKLQDGVDQVKSKSQKDFKHAQQLLAENKQFYSISNGSLAPKDFIHLKLKKSLDRYKTVTREECFRLDDCIPQDEPVKRNCEICRPVTRRVLDKEWNKKRDIYFHNVAKQLDKAKSSMNLFTNSELTLELFQQYKKDLQKPIKSNLTVCAKKKN